MKTLYMKHTEEIPLSVSEKRDLKEKTVFINKSKIILLCKKFLLRFPLEGT